MRGFLCLQRLRLGAWSNVQHKVKSSVWESRNWHRRLDPNVSTSEGYDDGTHGTSSAKPSPVKDSTLVPLYTTGSAWDCLALVSISYFCCHFALAEMAFCSRRSKTAVVDTLRLTLDISLSLLKSSLPEASAESLQGLRSSEG